MISSVAVALSVSGLLSEQLLARQLVHTSEIIIIARPDPRADPVQPDGTDSCTSSFSNQLVPSLLRPDPGLTNPETEADERGRHEETLLEEVRDLPDEANVCSQH